MLFGRVKFQVRLLVFFILIFAVVVYPTGPENNALAEDSIFAGGQGTAEDPYLIADGQQLSALRDYPDGHFQLIDDIDLSDFSAGSGWSPIGVFAKQEDQEPEPFTGTLRGEGYEISGVTINRPEENNVALFGYIDRAEIRDLNIRGAVVIGADNTAVLVGRGDYALLEEVNIEKASAVGQNSTGLLLGYNDHSEVIDCKVMGAAEGKQGVGLLMGRNYGSDISASYAEGSVLGEKNVAVLIGDNAPGDIINCQAEGSAVGREQVGGLAGNNIGVIRTSSFEGSVKGDEFVGGLIGRHDGTAVIVEGDGGIAARSYFKGSVYGRRMVGGITGANHGGIIGNVYSRGSVFAEGNDAGGIAGVNSGRIINCYTVVMVRGAENVSFLEGRSMGGSVEHSFYDLPEELDIFKDEIIEKAPDLRSKETFTGWDFEEVWTIDENETYPYLRWEE